MEPGRVFFVLSFVSMIVLHWRKGRPAQKSGGKHGRSGGRHRNGSMRGRAWISMTIDERIGLGG